MMESLDVPSYGLFTNRMDNSTVIPANGTNEECKQRFRSAEKAIFIAFGTFINCIAVMMLNHVRKQTKSRLSCLALLLACNDLFSCGSFLMSILINTASCDKFGSTLGCHLLGMISASSYAWSLYIVTVMSVERYLAIMHPFFHHKHCSLRTLFLVCSAGAAMDITTMLLPVVGVGREYRYYDDNRYCTLNFTADGEWDHKALIMSLAISGIIRSIIISFCNIVVSISIRRQPPGERNESRGRATANALAFARLTQVIAYTNVLLTVPFFIRILIHIAGNRNTPKSLDTRITAFLLFLSPLVNPFLYVISNKDCRNFLWQVVTCNRGHCPSIRNVTTPSNSTKETDINTDNSQESKV